MSPITKKVADYVNAKGINISNMSRETGIPYGILIASLGTSQRNRTLRDDEFIAICTFLEVNPMDFAEKK